MNKHQVLTGAVNSGNNCFSVGSVQGIPFTAYAAGCDIVILASDFQRIQIIPGITKGSVQVSCVDCSTDTGKIAAAYGSNIFIYEPTPLIEQLSTHKLDYHWVQTGTISADSNVLNLSWNPEGTRLLSSGSGIQLWQYILDSGENMTIPEESGVSFQVGNQEKDIIDEQWHCQWKCKTATPIYFLKFSPDGSLFASAGQNDRLVKIWHEDRKITFPQSVDRSTALVGGISYRFVYLAHPRAVTGLSWRQTSKYMPRGAVSNMLISSCKDNICRIWVQTILPDDGLINLNQFEPIITQNPKMRTQKHKQKIMQRLKHMKSFFNFKSRHTCQFTEEMQETIPSLPSTFSVHDYHSFGMYAGGIAPGFHFHLSASINAETDIPLVPSLNCVSNEPNFVLHWLNNKELEFTLSAEKVLEELSRKVLSVEASCNGDINLDNNLDDKGEKGVKKSKQAGKPSLTKSKSEDMSNGSQHSISSQSSSSTSIATDVSSQTQQSVLGDFLDHKIDKLVTEWSQSPDLLFSIHPVDGSFLVWLVEWLDEYSPSSFRQAQVSFSSRIPNALPLGDAVSMDPITLLYNPLCYFDIKSIMRNTDEKEDADSSKHKSNKSVNNPVICMISKHTNGTLNQWHLTFNEHSKYTQVLSIGHSSRVCGHRFRVNDITCHPVLPLLLTTSHHNSINSNQETKETSDLSSPDCTRFCSELILWKVDPVGPLSKSGGVVELARISAPQISAFSNVAWIPTLLPSTTLGSISNSPSACFVASDGICLRIYQAVIDSRTLLAEISNAERKNEGLNLSFSSSSSGGLGTKHMSLKNTFNVVSQQSTARPGCIIQLDSVSDAIHDWQNTLLLHVFQEQLITGECSNVDSGLFEAHHQPIVDLHNLAVFEQPFYLVVIEKNSSGKAILHMWKLIISSQPEMKGNVDDMDFNYLSETDITHESDHSNVSSRGSTPEPISPTGIPSNVHFYPLSIFKEKICSQELILPDGVEIVHATPSAGHLSSSSIYPACFAPYLICTACSDSVVRFWKCEVSKFDESELFTWKEWEMFNSQDSTSLIETPGQPLNVSCAYSGRIACAYKHGKSFTRPSSDNPSERFVNLSVVIYECESTGGSEWIVEDTIHLKNISLPEQSKSLCSVFGFDDEQLKREQKTASRLSRQLSPTAEIRSLVSVPSYSTLQTLRKTITEKGNWSMLTQKHLVQLDWVSTEDGSHILTIGVGSKIMLFTPVSSDIAQANIKAMEASKSSSQPVLRKASSMAVPQYQTDEIRWMKLRSIDLTSVDGLPPLPMQLSWARDGILIVGMDNEMHVYSQWKQCNDTIIKKNNDNVIQKQKKIDDMEETSRNLTDENLLTLTQDSSQLRVPNVSSVTRTQSHNALTYGVESRKKGKGKTSADLGAVSFPNYGLFEASRIACPVLPQYHPKQLMELLNFGKIRRVKAILNHLLRCIYNTGVEDKSTNKFTFNSEMDPDANSPRQRSWSCSRTLSVSTAQVSPLDPQISVSVVPEEVQLDYMEITSIPPLPLSTLLAADKEVTAHPRNNNQKQLETDYSDLFSREENEQSLDDILTSSADANISGNERSRNVSGDHSCTYFGPRQARLLTRLLTHTHIPGLSSLDQMHLLALADTIASCNTAFADRFTVNADNTAMAKETLSGSPNAVNSTDSLDDCGLRFLLAMRHHNYLLRCLPLSQRAQLQKQGLSSAFLVWAYHSDSEEELLNMLPSMKKLEPKWTELREIGVGWWVRNSNVLRRCIEKVAKAAFQANREPLDAALYYIAMKKKSVIWGLFRSVNDRRMTEFFQHNFTEERWRKAALKNAFALLGKQRFEHAAAFFLLAGSVRDAIEVCLNKIGDLQLAMMIVRMYEGDNSSSYRQLLFEEILGCDKNGDKYNPENAHPDPFLRSIAYWTLGDLSNSLNALLQNDIGRNHPAFDSEEGKCYVKSNPSVFNFYIYLRTHPLLIRKQIATSVQDSKGAPTLLLSGFSSADQGETVEKQAMFEDVITSLERRLYFTTAHAHFLAGCPALALEVLSKLPKKIVEKPTEDRVEKSSSSENQIKDNYINTGTLEMPSQPVKSDALDWSQPISQAVSSSTDFDWSIPTIQFDVHKDESLDLNFSEDEASSETSSKEDGKGLSFEVDKKSLNAEEDSSREEIPCKIDIMAQQLKFIACLKIMMEELSTLATGFEVDGGHLRYHLYVWLEREVNALTELCNYGGSSITVDTGCEDLDNEDYLTNEEKDKPTLHEILVSDKLDFEAKLQRAQRRKIWLKQNETLLRTLLSYCSLHGAHGGGLASVRMELILLLQELQQEKTQQILLSPLPFPTTLPLLSASIATCKTVITDPIRNLQSMAHDILCSVVELSLIGNPNQMDLCKMFVLRDLCMSLSSCIYQALCDSDSVKHLEDTSKVHMFSSSTCIGYAHSHLVARGGRRRLSSSNFEELAPTTAPSKWPGVQSLRALLAREKDDDSPKLTTLLCESFVAVYLSLLLYALSVYDCHLLFRLIGQNFNESTWVSLFGGGVKRLLKVAVNTSESQASNTTPEVINETGEQDNLFKALNKQRMMLNMKLLGQLGQKTPSQNAKEDRPTYREQFLPPEMSMIASFMSKPEIAENEIQYLGYDSDDSVMSDDDDEDEDGNVFEDNKEAERGLTEHSNIYSYSWAIMQMAIVKLSILKIQTFLNIVGIEMQELPVTSPLIHSCLKALEQWLILLKNHLNSFGGAPENYIPGICIEHIQSGPSIKKYNCLLESQNTPFRSKSFQALPAKRLWMFLIHKKQVQEIFIRYVFARQKPSSASVDAGYEEIESPEPSKIEPIKIIHKDQDSVSAFCLNMASGGLLALATPKEIQEVDINAMLKPLPWIEDNFEYDIMNLHVSPESLPASDYLVVQTPGDNVSVNGPSKNTGSVINSPTGSSTALSQTGRGASVLKRHKIDGIRRLCSHPILPLYLSGAQDGSVKLWEWGHSNLLSSPRPSGTYAKVTRVRFNEQGNKFGVSDGDGLMSLWQSGLSSSHNKAFFSSQCHTKQMSDFVFVGSSSLLASCGHSSDNRNVCLWDTLLPYKRSLVSSFVCHEQGSSSLLYGPHSQILISAGKRGDICIFDMRQRQLRHKFQAHDSSIKCMTLDPSEEFFVTGSADGDIKVWCLSVHSNYLTLPNEHSRSTFFRNIGVGVTQMYVDSSGRLFSCGADGSMKLRQLPDRDVVTHL